MKKIFLFVLVFSFLSVSDVSAQSFSPSNLNKYYYNDISLSFTTGAIPIKVGVGLGYIIKNKIEPHIGYNFLFIPWIANHRAFITGVKIYNSKAQKFFYDIETGPFYNAAPPAEKMYYDGWLISGGFGNNFYKNDNFYISYKLRLEIYLRKKDSPGYLPGIDLTIGWYK